MMKKYGFTIVELLVVIVVMGILLSIASIGLNRYQSMSRDSARASSATAITEALEKYYDEKGEYPGCTAMTASPQTIQTNTLKGADLALFIAPQAPAGTTNSIQCIDLSPSATNDAFAYVGDSSQTCLTGTACAKWTFKYRNESKKQIETIQSKHSAITVPPTVQVTAVQCSMAGIKITWTTLVGVQYYRAEVSTSSTFQTLTASSTVGPSTTSFIPNNLSHNTTYYVRVLPYISATQPTEWSATRTASTSGTGAGTCS